MGVEALITNDPARDTEKRRIVSLELTILAPAVNVCFKRLLESPIAGPNNFSGRVRRRQVIQYSPY